MCMLLKGDAKTGSTNTARDIMRNPYFILRRPGMLTIKASQFFLRILYSDTIYHLILELDFSTNLSSLHKKYISNITCVILAGCYMEVSWNGGTPKSSMFMGLSTINHPLCCPYIWLLFWGPRPLRHLTSTAPDDASFFKASRRSLAARVGKKLLPGARSEKPQDIL